MGAETTLDPSAPLSQGSTAVAASRLLTIYEIGRNLLEQREPSQVILAIHRSIVEHLKPDHVCILRIGPDGSYEPVTSHNLDLE